MAWRNDAETEILANETAVVLNCMLIELGKMLDVLNVCHHTHADAHLAPADVHAITVKANEVAQLPAELRRRAKRGDADINIMP